MYACMHVCMYLCIFVSMYLCMYGCMYGCMDVWMYGCMDVWMYVCMYDAGFFPLVPRIFPLRTRKARKRAFKGKNCGTKGKKFVCM